MQRPDSRQPLCPNHQYYEQNFQPTYPEQWNYQSIGKRNLNIPSRTLRQIAGPMNHSSTITQEADRILHPPSISSTVSEIPTTSKINAEYFFSGRPREIQNMEIELDNRNNLNICEFQQLVNNGNVACSAVKPSSNTEATGTTSQATIISNVNVIRTDRLMHGSQGNVYGSDDNYDKNLENFRINCLNSTNQITLNETVTRNTTSVEVDAVNQNNSSSM